MAHENDASYKLLFSAPELVRDLVMGFILDARLHSLDYSTLEKAAAMSPMTCAREPMMSSGGFAPRANGSTCTS